MVLLIDCYVIFGENPVRLASVLANLWKWSYCSRRGHCSPVTVHRLLFTPRGPTFNGNLND
ncbi:hypothetical protein SLEP1_g27687 [Rubroshorea leprosula]|uniref:Uncharacterized protein n=1 Tax=Rubroshorea leprosula TaxID=152421 RepID=A0AAV5K0X2_9ROSI|nr:hypothetical protein SLEP1_g27687 [Rubroshorea leprosula]